MGFFGRKRNTKSNSTPGIDTGNNNNDVVLQGRMQDLQSDMQRVKQRHEAEMQMLNKRMVSIVAKVHTTPPPPPPGPPPGGRPPSRRRSRGSGSAGRDSSIHSSNMSQRSSDNQSNPQRRRSRQEHQYHTRHFYQLPQPIQSAPPVSEISIVAESVGSANASTSSRNHYTGDDNSSHDTSHASHTSYSYKNGRKVRTVYRTVRAVDDGDGDRAVPPTPTTAPEHEIRAYRSPGRSRQSAEASSSSYDRNGVVVRNHPPPENSPIRSNIKTLRGRVHATDSAAFYDVGSSSPRSSSDRRKNRNRGEYHTSRKNNNTTTKEKWTPSRPAPENNTMPSERNSSRRNYRDYSIPERDVASRSSLSDGIGNSRQNNVRRPTRLSADVLNDDAYNHRVANAKPHGVYEATDHVENRNTRPSRNQVNPGPALVARPQPTKSGGAPIDLMASIRAGVQLKSVSDEMTSEPPRVPQESPVNVLMAAIQERKKHILAQQEEDEVDW